MKGDEGVIELLNEALRNELRAAANRACELDFRIVVNVPPEPDLSWRAVAADGEIRLEGEVPDQTTKSDLALSAAKLFPQARLVDRLEVKPAYSKKWPKVTDTGLKLLAKLRSGEVPEERRIVLEQIQRQGILTLDVPADELSVSVINRYLEIKAREMI